MGSTIEEVTDWEQRVEDYQDNFQKISEVIKVSQKYLSHWMLHKMIIRRWKWSYSNIIACLISKTLL